MIKLSLSIVLICGVMISRAQREPVDSVLSLPSVLVTAERSGGFVIGQKIDHLDQIFFQPLQSQSLAQVMASSTSLQVNSYSFNGLSTLSFRGTSGAHTGILWRGIPLNQATNGLFDLSLLQTGLFDKIRVLYGGGSSVLGSGTIGGSIHLGSEPEFESGLEVLAGLFGGSFGVLGGSAGVRFASGKWVINTRMVGRTAENNFSYTDLSGEGQKLSNARQQQGGLLQEIYYQTGNGWIFGGSFWYQENEKEIPATLTSKPSDASQSDRSVRTLATVQKRLKKGEFQLRSAMFQDKSLYRDPDPVESIAIDSEIFNDQWVADATFNHSLGTYFSLRAGSRYMHTESRTGNYEKAQILDQTAVFASLVSTIPSIGWKFNLNLRQEWASGYEVPLTPSFGAEGRISRSISGKVSISKNFRLPSMNDRYWIPGGNPDIQPETSWNQEASLLVRLEMPKMRNQTQFVVTVYNANVDGWILWIPEGTFWTARNIQKVWARGAEIEYQSSLDYGPVQVLFNGGYSYTRSTNETKTSGNDQSSGKQLIYIPEHRYFFTGKLLFKDYSLAYNQSFTGKRYTTRDNSTFLPSYSIGTVYLRKVIFMKGHSIDPGLAINNIWDVEYQSVEYNPMPGRYLEINVLYKFNKPKK